MSYDQHLQDLWGEIDDVAIELAQVRDSYIQLRGENKKAGHLTHAYSRLLEVETALYEYIRKDRSPAREDADRLAYMMARANVDFARSMTAWANDDLQKA